MSKCTGFKITTKGSTLVDQLQKEAIARGFELEMATDEQLVTLIPLLPEKMHQLAKAASEGRSPSFVENILLSAMRATISACRPQ